MRKTVLIREQYQADQHWMEVAHLIAVADAIIAFFKSDYEVRLATQRSVK
jgi:hypothetical protein